MWVLLCKIFSRCENHTTFQGIMCSAEYTLTCNTQLPNFPHEILWSRSAAVARRCRRARKCIRGIKHATTGYNRARYRLLPTEFQSFLMVRMVWCVRWSLLRLYGYMSLALRETMKVSTLWHCLQLYTLHHGKCCLQSLQTTLTRSSVANIWQNGWGISNAPWQK